MTIEPTIAPGAPFRRWFDHAVCREGTLAEFFDHRVVGGRPSHHAYLAARRYCARCPVLASCRREADRHDDVGLWGGQWRTGDRARPAVDLLPGGSGRRTSRTGRPAG